MADQAQMNAVAPAGIGRSSLSLRNVSKAFGPTQALDDVSLSLERGTIHALLGGNGSGKSTLIKILAGVQGANAGQLECSHGSFDLRSFTPALAHEIGLRFVHQQTSTFPDLTIAENLCFGEGFEKTRFGRIRWRATRNRAADVLDRFGIDAHPEEDLGELSPAKQTMVAIARALQGQDGASEGVLVLDEPTAALPDSEVTLLLDALRRYATAGQTILYVTHRLEEVFAAANRATLLRDGRLVDTVTPSELSHDGMIELMTGHSVSQVERFRGEANGPVVLEVDGLAAGPLKSVDLSVRSGEIVGISGLIGSGRSSLLKSLFGLIPADAGEIRVEGKSLKLSDPRVAMNSGFALVPENRAADAALIDLSVKENLSISVLDEYWGGGHLRQKQEASDSRELIDDFFIKAESIEAPLGSLSGGNQQKVILARWMRRNPKVLLLDEPTQGVDVGARAEIYELIHRAVTAGAIALIVSSDFEELVAVCDRVIALRKGRVIGELAGTDLEIEAIQRLAHAELEFA